MFEIKLSQARQVVLVRFWGDLVERDFTDLQELGRVRAAGASYDCIFDLTDVHTSQINTDFISRRGSLPQQFTDRHRIYVVPQEDFRLLVRLYGAYQETQGWRAPSIVERLDAAFAMLKVNASDFKVFS